MLLLTAFAAFPIREPRIRGTISLLIASLAVLCGAAPLGNGAVRPRETQVSQTVPERHTQSRL